MYKVSTNIPPGESVLIGSGYFSISKDSTLQILCLLLLPMITLQAIQL